MSRLALLLAPLFLAACDVPAAQGPKRPLPAYAGHAVELFDDSIEPAAVGISMEAKVDPRTDKRLRERAQVGDAVIRLRVTTLTAKQEDSGTRYLVGLKTIEVLTGQFPPGDTFEITVSQLSPAAGILKSMQDQFVGKTFVGFVRAFVRADGDQELHFHFAPDSPAEAIAVKDAAALSSL
jgi:hypothetical protein